MSLHFSSSAGTQLLRNQKAISVPGLNHLDSIRLIKVQKLQIGMKKPLRSLQKFMRLLWATDNGNLLDRPINPKKTLKKKLSKKRLNSIKTKKCWQVSSLFFAIFGNKMAAWITDTSHSQISTTFGKTYVNFLSKIMQAIMFMKNKTSMITINSWSKT